MQKLISSHTRAIFTSTMFASLARVFHIGIHKVVGFEQVVHFFNGWDLNNFILRQKGKQIVCYSIKGEDIINRLFDTWYLIRDLDWSTEEKNNILKDITAYIDYYFGDDVVSIGKSQRKSKTNNLHDGSLVFNYEDEDEDDSETDLFIPSCQSESESENEKPVKKTKREQTVLPDLDIKSKIIHNNETRLGIESPTVKENTKDLENAKDLFLQNASPDAATFIRNSALGISKSYYTENELILDRLPFIMKLFNLIVFEVKVNKQN